MRDPCPYHDELARKVDEIHVAVVGNEPIGHRGLAKRIAEQESKTDWLYAKMVGVLACGAMLIKFIEGHLNK